MSKTWMRVLGALMLALFLFLALPLAAQDDAPTAYPEEVVPGGVVEAWGTDVAVGETLMTATAAPDAPVIIDIDVSPGETGPVETPAPSEWDISVDVIDILVIVALFGIGMWTARRDGRQAPGYWQDALKRADATQTGVDDLLLRTAIYLQGYTIEKLPDGSYKVTPPSPPSGAG